jgi:hypothetical protein
MAVNLTAPAVLRIERTRRRSTRRRAVAAPPCASTVAAKRCGGTEDTALYSCDCGYAFTAEVTTTVGCPQCGTQQAW